jgi:hypothetical protein
MATLIPAKQIDFDSSFSGSISFENIFVSGALGVSGSFILGSSEDILSEISSSIDMTGSLILNGDFQIGDILIDETEIQFTNDGEIVGSIAATTDGIVINGTFFGDNYIIGNYSGSGDNLFFTRVGTNEPNPSVMVIGNYYNDYENLQTTIFPNSNIIVSGSVEIADGGYLILNPLDEAPDMDDDKGGLYYSTDGYYYLMEFI